MSNWMQAFGHAALTGSEMIGRNRLEKKQDEARAKDDEMRAAQLALAGRSADLADRSFTAGESDRNFNRTRIAAQDVVEQVGPGGQLDAAGLAALEAAGWGGRAGHGEAVSQGTDPLGIPGAQITTPTRVLTPNFAEQSQIDAVNDTKAMRDRQMAALKFVDSDAFDKQPYEKRARAYAEAGLGNLPDDPAKARAHARNLAFELANINNPDAKWQQRMSPEERQDAQWATAYQKAVSERRMMANALLQSHAQVGTGPAPFTSAQDMEKWVSDSALAEVQSVYGPRTPPPMPGAPAAAPTDSTASPRFTLR
jgi:hypothetical protein